MPWVAAGLGGNALVTQGLGDGVYVIVLELWESPYTFQTRTGQRDAYAIMLRLEPRRKRKRIARRTRYTGG